MVRFSIIIPNYNGQDFLESCIASILSQDFSDYEIILVDNASVDQSVELVRTRFPSVRIVGNKENRGYAGGCNDGIANSSGEYCLFLNTDTILEHTFLSYVHTAILAKPEYGMYAPKILYPDGTLQAAGSSASLSGSSWERGRGTKKDPAYDIPCEVFGPYGAAAIFSRELLTITGGFDDDFFLFVEETDLTFRGRLAGYRCWYMPEAVVTHYHGGTAGRSSDMALYYLHRNVIWYVIKDFPLFLLIFSFPIIFGRQILVLLYYICKGRGKVVLCAKRDALKEIPKFIKKRRSIYNRGKFTLSLNSI